MRVRHKLRRAGQGWAFSRSSSGVWLPQRQGACPSSSCWAGLAAPAVSSPGGPSCAQVRHDRWQEGEWNCPAEVRPNPAEEVPEGTSRRPWVSTPTSQPLEVNPGHAVSPSYQPGWRLFPSQLLSRKALSPFSPPQGGQERRQLSGAFTPHLIPGPACDVGLACGFQGEKARRGLGEVSSGVTDPVNQCPLPAIPGSSFFPHKTPWLLFPLREPRQMLKARVPLSHCEH